MQSLPFDIYPLGSPSHLLVIQKDHPFYSSLEFPLQVIVDLLSFQFGLYFCFKLWPIRECFFVSIAYFLPYWVLKFSPQRLWCRNCYVITSSTFSLVDTRHLCRTIMQDQNSNENPVIQAVIGVLWDYGISRSMQQRTDGDPVLPIKMLAKTGFWWVFYFLE